MLSCANCFDKRRIQRLTSLVILVRFSAVTARRLARKRFRRPSTIANYGFITILGLAIF